MPVENNLISALPTHPGSILKDEIEYRGLSKQELAQEMGIPYSTLMDILACRVPLTAEIALLFEAVLDIDAEPLISLQTKYNMRTLREDRSFMKRLADVRKYAAVALL